MNDQSKAGINMPVLQFVAVICVVAVSALLFGMQIATPAAPEKQADSLRSLCLDYTMLPAEAQKVGLKGVRPGARPVNEVVRRICLGALEDEGRDPLLLERTGTLFFASKRYDAANKFWKAAEAAGSARASSGVGLLLLEGHGVEKNVSLARQQFLKAVRAGDHRANLFLAQLSLYGVGVEKNTAAALQYLNEASRTVGSDVFLYEAYAYIYSNGDGVPKDDVKAKRYAKQATELKKEIQKEKERVWAEFSTPDPRQPSQRVAATSANNSAASKIGDAVVEEMVQYGTRSVLEYFFGGKN